MHVIEKFDVLEMKMVNDSKKKAYLIRDCQRLLWL